MVPLYLQQFFTFLTFSTTTFYFSNADGSLISVAPVDTVGCYGGISTFYCESERNNVIVQHIGWQLDGYTIIDEIAQLRGISITTNGVGNSSLSIIGSEDNNDILIGCAVVTSGPPYFDSQSALFTVSDIPPVTNLTITFTNNGTTMNCTWIQPSCLPVNYSYSISINNVTVTNTTNTVYSTSNIEPCTNYTVSVTVTDKKNMQYKSLSISKTTRIRILEDFDVDLWITNVYFHDDVNRSASVEFQVSEKYRSNLYQLFYNCSKDIFDRIVPPQYSEYKEITVIDILQSYNESTGIGYYTIGPFNDSFIGNYTLKNHDEEIASTRISTFNVQNATINHLLNGSTMMECSFAYNSPANGCQVELIFRNETLRSITKDDFEDTATLYTDLDIPEGEYDVHVHDIVNGSVTIESAVNTTYNHNYIPPSNRNSTTIKFSITTDHTIFLPSTVSTITNFTTIMLTISPTNIRGEDGFSYIVIGGTIAPMTISLLLLITILVMIVCIIRYKRHKKFQLGLHSEIALVQMATTDSHTYGDLPAHTTPSTRTIEHEDNDYMEDVVDFHNAKISSTHTQSVLPSAVNTTHDTNGSLRQTESCDKETGMNSTSPPPYHIASSLPSMCEQTDSRLCDTTPHDTTESKPQNTESTYLPSYLAATVKCEQEVNTETNTEQTLITQSLGLTSDRHHDEPLKMSTEVTTAESDQFSNSAPSSSIVSSVSTPSHGPIPNTRYAQLVLNTNPSNDSTHHPVPRLTESHSGYVTINQTRQVCTEQCSYPVYANTGRRKPNEQ